MSDWISVEDELPMPNKMVWVCTEKGGQWSAKRIAGMSLYLSDGQFYLDNITHWQPLLEPPKGAQK